jgi:hypothetical protein
MLPIRKSMPIPSGRAPAIAVEVSVPAFGIWFAAIAATVRADGIFLSTFREVEAGTRVEVEIALPDGPPVKVAGIVGEHPLEGIGIDIAFEALDADTRARIEAIVPSVPIAPDSGVRTRVA